MISKIFAENEQELLVVPFIEEELQSLKLQFCEFKGYKIVGKLSDIDLSEYVDSFIGKYSGRVYLDYNTDIDFLFELKTPYESFISLCKSQDVQIDENKEYLIIKIIK